MKKLISIILISLVLTLGISNYVDAKSYIKSYKRGSSTVRSYIRYKADGYKFNNYMYRPDRGYRK
jgi:hypothetical protein